jgi:HPt (histidine-containing phosphotransfer) domain-containing protein
MTSEARPPFVDIPTVRQVHANVTPGTATEFYESFLAEITNHGLIDGNGEVVEPESLQSLSHTLKSTCGTFGLALLADLAASISKACREGDLETAARLAAAFDSATQPSISAMREVLSSLDG